MTEPGRAWPAFDAIELFLGPLEGWIGGMKR